MGRKDLFLTIALEKGKIKEDSRRYALQQQRQSRLSHVNKRVGEILIESGLLTAAGCDEILHEQDKRRSARFYGLRRLNPNMNLASLQSQRLLVIILASVGVGIANQFGIGLDPATGIFGFITLVLFTIIEYRAVHSKTLSLIRAFIFCCGLFVLISFSYSVYTFTQLSEIINTHADTATQSRVSNWLFRVKGAFLALGGAAIILALYSVWKFHALRYTQARAGSMKDTIIRVEGILRNKSKQLSVRQDEAITTVLRGLRNAIRLSLPDRTLRRFTFFFPGRDQITVMYFIPEPDHRRFRLEKVEYPEDAPEKVREGFRWMQANHFPTFLNEEVYRERVTLMKGRNPQGWRGRFLNLLDRHTFISVCGWIYARGETLFSRDASQCLAYDGRYFERIKEHGLNKDELSWINFGSFIGCPVIGPDSEVASILIVAKSRNNSLEPEDLEITIVASQLIGRVLSCRTEDAPNGS